MQNVTVPNHPLLRHKLTLLRDRFTPTSMFRNWAAARISPRLCSR